MCPSKRPWLPLALALVLLATACPTLKGHPDAGIQTDASASEHDDAGSRPNDDADAADDAGPAASDDGGPRDAGALVPVARPIGVSWIHGAPNCGASTDPPLQSFRYDDDTVILRQSKCVNFEGPILFLLFGSERVLLIDTGATASASAFPLRDTVEGLMRIGKTGA